jgi:xanthine dehydrogenase accessory factor
VKDIQEVLEAYELVKRSEKNARLATLVKVKGSAFRRPGARMLIRNDGTFVGALSSGCLEADIAERAMKLMNSFDAITVTYDTSSPQDDVWGLNLGCNGILQVLLEPLPLSIRSLPLKSISDCISSGTTGVLATVFRVDGELKVAIGSHLFLAENGTIAEDVKHPPLCAALTEDCLLVLRSKSTSNKEYRFTEGVVEALIEFVRPPVPLFIFGAGADAVPLARMAKELGWTVTVVDHRPAFMDKARFDSADRFVLGRPEEVGGKIHLAAEAVAVILTLDFSLDLALLRILLPSPVSYIGLLGPAKRSEQLIQELRETGFTPTADQLSRLYAPVGLDIGADSPEEMALSILSEIQAFLGGRSGGFLRDRSGPIHT